MSDKPYFVEAEWRGDRQGTVQAEPIKALDFSAPPEFGGKAGVWTPEHLLLASVTSCYIATFSAIAELNHFQFRGLRVTAEASLEKVPGGMRFARILLRPRLIIDDQGKHEQALLLVEKAKKACIISRSLAAEVLMDAAIGCCGEKHDPVLV